MAAVKKRPKAEDSPHPDISAQYFAPLLPWQAAAWNQVVSQYRQAHLPHAMLAAGMAGIGKRAFVMRLSAWLLCHQQPDEGACGQCDSCQWLKAGTHPDMRRLPQMGEGVSSIKIDDIRALQDFLHIKSQHARLLILDHSDTMTIAAANALLKTLEEPSAGVYLILISDRPARLLPTIKSRLQTLPLSPVDADLACAFVMDSLKVAKPAALNLLTLSDYAPLVARDLPSMPWYAHRTTWLKTYKALQAGARSPVAASDYWQGVLSLTDFVSLSRMMLLALWRLGLGLPSLHEDIGAESIMAGLALDADGLAKLLVVLDDVTQAAQQNVQDKLAYDALMVALAGAAL